MVSTDYKNILVWLLFTFYVEFFRKQDNINIKSCFPIKKLSICYIFVPTLEQFAEYKDRANIN